MVPEFCERQPFQKWKWNRHVYWQLQEWSIRLSSDGVPLMCRTKVVRSYLAVVWGPNRFFRHISIRQGKISGRQGLSLNTTPGAKMCLVRHRRGKASELGSRERQIWKKKQRLEWGVEVVVGINPLKPTPWILLRLVHTDSCFGYFSWATLVVVINS